MPQLKLFLLAISFYTRLPGPNTLDYKQLPQAAVYFPLVGWLVGGITASGFYIADLVWPQTTAVILAIILGIFVTGAFHEDGFADVCDGFSGGYGKPAHYGNHERLLYRSIRSYRLAVIAFVEDQIA